MLAATATSGSTFRKLGDGDTRNFKARPAGHLATLLLEGLLVNHALVGTLTSARLRNTLTLDDWFVLRFLNHALGNAAYRH